MKRVLTFPFAIALLISTSILAQDSLDVTFRYTASDEAVRVMLPGDFNSFGPNTDGVISPTAISLMSYDGAKNYWFKTLRLEVGGGPSTNGGESGYRYKFHEHKNASGTNNEWLADPLNSDIAAEGFGDSWFKITHPLVFQMEPLKDQIFQTQNVEIIATVAAKDSDPISETNSKIYINDVEAGTFEDYYDSDLQVLSIPDISTFGLSLVEGSNEVKIVAVTGDGATITDSTDITFLVVDVDNARPEGLKDGITYGEDGTSVTFSLFAPYKDNAFLIGDFNDWSVDLDYQMYRDSIGPDDIYFWKEITGLSAGQVYGFQYLVDGDVRIADPYSAVVLDEHNDGFIPESVFPNLKDYPVGKTSGLVGLLEPGKEEYDWEATEYQRPDKESLVIYELLIRDFLEDHSFSSLIDTLDYLEGLGINAIELMPVNEFGGNISWGYNPSSHIALDKYYGTPDKFKEFVDESHKRGIAVIVDVVLNHATNDHSLYQLYDFGSNPYFNTSPKHSYNVHNDFNHQYSGTQQYTKLMIEHWINEYKVDGFRWDLTKGFTQNCTSDDESCTNSYQQDRVDVLKKYADYQWEVDPDFIVIFEHLGTDQEETQWADYRIDEGNGIMLWGKMNSQYNEATMGYHEGGKSNLFGVLSDSKSFQKRHLVGYMESHDEQWLMFKTRSFGNSSGDYNVKDLSTALDRQELVGAFFFTLPGPKMMWQFGELGYGYGNSGEQCLKPGGDSNGDCAPSVAGRVDPKPIRWDYYEDSDRIELYNTWSNIINLRNSSEAFTNPETTFYSLSGATKRIRFTHSDTDVVIAGNFGVTATTLDLDFTKDGVWFDYLGLSQIDVTGAKSSIDLGPGEFKIFTTKQFSIGTSSEDDFAETGLPTNFKLHQNYPNPFNPSTNLTYEVANSGKVQLEVFNLLGQRVAELVNDQKAPGVYTVSFDASSLSSGIYIARFVSGGIVQTQKMTLLK